GHADLRRRAGTGLPSQAGPDVAERARRTGDRRGYGRPELPDRAPPVPGHALAAPGQGAADRARVLRGEGHPLPRDRPDPVLAGGPDRTPPQRRTAPEPATG